MGARITRANLDGMAETLTVTLKRAGVIRLDEHVTLYGAYGGWAFHVTGGAELGTAHRNGVAGLTYGCEPARVTYDNASAVVNAVRAVLWAVSEGATLPVQVES